MFTLSVNIVLIILRGCRYVWKTSWESLLFSLSVTLFLCHLFTHITSSVVGGGALLWDGLSHCVSLLRTSPLLMWHGLRGWKICHLWAVTGCITTRLHVGRDAKWDQSERRESGLCVWEVWRGGCLETWHKRSLQLLGFGGSGPNYSVTSGNTSLSGTKLQRKETLHWERNHSHPVNLCLSSSYLTLAHWAETLTESCDSDTHYP